MNKNEIEQKLIRLSDYTVEQLGKDLGLTYSQLSRRAAQIDRDGYVKFVKPTRSKTRVFGAPAQWLKKIQRDLADRFFPRLPISQHVYSQAGHDVVENASQHVGRSYRLSMDLSDCYPSTTLGMVRDALTHFDLPGHVVGLVARLVTHNGRLPQGSPCSPAMLDRVLFQLDEALALLAQEHGGVYTRFADDLTFSADIPLVALRRRATKLIRASGYSVRQEKTRDSGPGELHLVTGVAVGSTLHAPVTYVQQVSSDISAYGRGRRIQKEQSLRGKIQWVARLDHSAAQELDHRMTAASEKRRNGRVRSGQAKHKRDAPLERPGGPT